MISKIYCELSEKSTKNHFWLVNGTILFDLQEEGWDSLTEKLINNKIRKITSRIKEKFLKENNELSKMNDIYVKIKNQILFLKHKPQDTLISAPLRSIFTNELLNNETGGLKVCDLFIDDEYLKTIACIITKNDEKQFLLNYERIYSVKYNIKNENGREEEKEVFAVVPKSARRIIEDNDHNILYTLVILKRAENSICEIFKNHHYIIRNTDEITKINNNNINNDIDINNEERIRLLEKEQEKIKFGILKWCHEAYVDWIHLKVIRLFVESKLRYGPQGSFIPLFIRVHPNMEKILEKILISKYAEFGGKIYTTDNCNEILGSAGENTEYPFVCVKIENMY